FFSSRRRHTRWPRDWSSDVCSSDLQWFRRRVWVQQHLRLPRRRKRSKSQLGRALTESAPDFTDREVLSRFVTRPRTQTALSARRSEERRVGTEWSRGGSTYKEGTEL